MKYLSTRGVVEGLTFENALFKSYATDGGMFMPSDTPHGKLLQRLKFFINLVL